LFYQDRLRTNARRVDETKNKTGIGEELELRFFRTRLAHIAEWMQEANAALGSAVTIGAVLLDMEQVLFSNSPSCSYAILNSHMDG
jgi:hypothetical protein